MHYFDLFCTSAPGPVSDISVELRQGADNVTAVLSWLPPDEPNGVITQYQVFYAGYNGTQVPLLVLLLLFKIIHITHIKFVAIVMSLNDYFCSLA